MKARVHWIAALVLIGLLGGCTTQVGDGGNRSIRFDSKAKASPRNEKKTPQLEITVTASNTVLVEGETVTLEQLASRLDETKAKGESVWYYRESPTTKAPPITKEVLGLVMERGLALSISTEPDFSTWIDEAGNSRSR